MLYLSIAVYLLILVYLYDIRQIEPFRAYNQIAIFSIFVLLAGLRYRLAPDTVAYMSSFSKDAVPISELNLSSFTESRYQPLWVLLNSICKSLGSYILLQLLCSFILNLCVLHFFRKITSKVFSCLLFYYLIDYFYFNMEIVRESLALSMFLISVIKYNEGKVLTCYIFIVLAAMFHQFALMFLLVPLYMSNYITIRIKGIFAMSLIILLLIIKEPLMWLGQSLSAFSTIDLSFYDVAREMTIFGYLYAFLRILPVILVLVFYWNKAIHGLKLKKHIAFDLITLFAVIVIIRATTIPFVDRLANYFIIVVIAVVVTALYDFFDKHMIRAFQFSSVALTGIVSFLFYVLPMLKKDPIFEVPIYKRYYPYYSIFTKGTDPDREFATAIEAKE